MAYFVTGSTGFIGRHLVELLLKRDEEIHLLVRETSRQRLEALVEGWGGHDRIHPVVGDLDQPLLGLTDGDVKRLGGKITHFFHLAAIYDMTADEERNRVLNVEGTRHAVDLANELQVGHLHHVSSIAAAGEYKGLFREDMFDEGQRLPSPYHRTKFESERLVRDRATVPWRVYRPAVVVGHSQTGEMDKVDGPYYFFKAIQRARHLLPEWVPLIGPEMGWSNIVPVDYVAAALDHIAHQDGLDGQAFHLTNPQSQRSGDIINAFARAAHAPQLQMRIDKKLTDALPKGVISMIMQLPALKDIRKQFLADLGIPEEVIRHIALIPQFDTRDTERALKGSGIEVPDLDDYADRLWDYWERNLDPDLFKDRSLSAALRGKTVVITGASSGIGREVALKVAAAGGVPLLVARGIEKLEELKREIEDLGGAAYVYPTDLTDLDAIASLVERLLADHPAIDFLVNNAGRSIRRSVALSYDRFHDFERTMQLNYFGTIKLILGVLPHMSERGSGHIVNVSSIGVQTNPPRFSAYVASKAALDAFTRIVATETLGRNVTFTTIHMPLVRTPMIAPTKIYDSFPTITPDEAADMVTEALRSKPKHVGTRLGTFGEVMYALAPKAVDQVLHMAYKVFPDSTAAKGEGKEKDKGADEKHEQVSGEAVALAHIMRGVHW
jgi:NAD(P)-dependent dehydrogenase (short-subunit alcohol dehydrogenase family)